MRLQPVTGLLMASLLLLPGCLSPTSLEPSAQPGHPAPAAELETVEGGTWALSEHRGQVVVIDAMSPFCTICRAQMPELSELWEANKGSGLQLVSVDVGAAMARGSARGDMIDFRDRSNATWTFALDSGASFMVDYRVTVIPTILVIDPEGIVHARFQGTQGDAAALQTAVDQALGGLG